MFLEALMILNSWAEPVAKSEMPVSLAVYASNPWPDSIQVGALRFELLSDTLMAGSQRDSSRSTGRIDSSRGYWGLRNDGRIAWECTVPSRDSVATEFGAYRYENGVLARIDYYQSGTHVVYTRFEYAGGVLKTKVRKSLTATDSSVTVYVLESGRPVSFRESYGRDTSQTTLMYEGDRVTKWEKVGITGASSPYTRKYSYSGGRLARIEDYDIDRLSLVWRITYGDGTGILPHPTRPAGAESGRFTDALGRDLPAVQTATGKKKDRPFGDRSFGRRLR